MGARGPKPGFVVTLSHRRRISEALNRHKRTKQHSENIAKALKGRRLPEASIDKIKLWAKENSRRNWLGGDTGEYFAALLCPLGYRREYQFVLEGRQMNLDFALVAEKINIELDGPYHFCTANSTPEREAERDIILRRNGWKVIRVKHT